MATLPPVRITAARDQDFLFSFCWHRDAVKPIRYNHDLDGRISGALSIAAINAPDARPNIQRGNEQRRFRTAINIGVFIVAFFPFFFQKIF